MNINDLVSRPQDEIRTNMLFYYKCIALAFISYILVSYVRNWSNQKEVEITVNIFRITLILLLFEKTNFEAE